MKKMLKIMAMLLVIATVIFAAGCAEKKTATEAENETSTEVTNEGSVEEQNVTDAANVTNVTENVTENVTAGNNSTEENIADPGQPEGLAVVEEPAGATGEPTDVTGAEAPVEDETNKA